MIFWIQVIGLCVAIGAALCALWCFGKILFDYYRTR